jgi:hypothetical protein
MATLRAEARAHGRGTATIPVSLAVTLGEARRGRASLGVEPAEIAHNAKAYADAGLDALLVSTVTTDPAAARASLETVAAALLR